MAAGKGDRGGSTNSSTPTFNKVVSGNPEGRGGSTNAPKGKVGSYQLSGNPSTNPSNPTAKVGMLKGNKAC